MQLVEAVVGGRRRCGTDHLLHLLLHLGAREAHVKVTLSAAEAWLSGRDEPMAASIADELLAEVVGLTHEEVPLRAARRRAASVAHQTRRGGGRGDGGRREERGRQARTPASDTWHVRAVSLSSFQRCVPESLPSWTSGRMVGYHTRRESSSPAFEPLASPSIRLKEVTMPATSFSSGVRPRSPPSMSAMQPM